MSFHFHSADGDGGRGRDAVDGRGFAQEARLDLQRQHKRNRAAMEPEPRLAGGFPHVALLALPGPRVARVQSRTQPPAPPDGGRHLGRQQPRRRRPVGRGGVPGGVDEQVGGQDGAVGQVRGARAQARDPGSAASAAAAKHPHRAGGDELAGARVDVVAGPAAVKAGQHARAVGAEVGVEARGGQARVEARVAGGQAAGEWALQPREQRVGHGPEEQVGGVQRGGGGEGVGGVAVKPREAVAAGVWRRSGGGGRCCAGADVGGDASAVAGAGNVNVVMAGAAVERGGAHDNGGAALQHGDAGGALLP